MSLLEYSEQILFTSASLIYGSAFLVASFHLFSRGAYPQKWIFRSLILGFLAQSIALNIRAIFVESCPLGNTFEITQFIVWSLILLYFIIKPAFKVNLLGYFTALIASISTATVLIFPGLDSAYTTPSKAPLESLIELHASLAIFSYAIFALLAIASAMLLIQQYGLKKQLFKGLFRYLPSIQKLDALSTGLLWAGVFTLFVSLIFGTVFWIEEPERVPALKFTASLVLFLAYTLLGLCKTLNFVSPSKRAILSMVLILSAILSLGTIDSDRSEPEIIIEGKIQP